MGWIDENPDSISENELQNWISGGYISFLGKRNDVRPIIKSCMIYVLPSYREGTPRTVLEAMAMGRPIITTNVAGCRDTVECGKNGYLASAKNVNELIEQMEKFISNPNISNQLGIESRKIAEEKFDVNKVNSLMLRHIGIS